MGYHMREIVNVCMVANCNRDARYRVYGPRNEAFGDFCKPHATTKVIDLDRYEQACDYAKAKETR